MTQTGTPSLEGFNVEGFACMLRGRLTVFCETKRNETKSKAPVSQLVNADDTSVIEIKTQHYLES